MYVRLLSSILFLIYFQGQDLAINCMFSRNTKTKNIFYSFIFVLQKILMSSCYLYFSNHAFENTKSYRFFYIYEHGFELFLCCKTWQPIHKSNMILLIRVLPTVNFSFFLVLFLSRIIINWRFLNLMFSSSFHKNLLIGINWSSSS